MTKAVRSDTPSDLNGEFLREYSTEKPIRRYTRNTAGHGISYLLDHDYGRLYLNSSKIRSAV